LPFILLAAYLMDGVWRGLEEYFVSGEAGEEIIWGLRSRTFFWVQVGGMLVAGFSFYITALQLTTNEIKATPGAGTKVEWLPIWIPPMIALLFFTAIFSIIGLKVAIRATLAVAFGLLTFFLLHTGFTYAFDHGD